MGWGRMWCLKKNHCAELAVVARQPNRCGASVVNEIRAVAAVC